MSEQQKVHDADVPLDRDLFLRTLLRHLSGALQEIVGTEEAGGFISIVGQRIGDEIDAGFKKALQVERLDRTQVAAVLVELKRRIEGDFYLIEENEDRLVFGNRACPFGAFVEGRPSLCMMTSNVFGAIAAQNLGYAKVSIEQAIARGDAGCRVVVHLRRRPGSDAERAEGREYVRQ